MSARYFAATSSFPGGLVVLMRRNPCSQPIAYTSICERVEFTGEDVCAPVPSVVGVPAWGPTGVTKANMSARVTANTTSRAGVRGRAILIFPQIRNFCRGRTDERYYHVYESRSVIGLHPVSQVQSSSPSPGRAAKSADHPEPGLAASKC